LEKFDTLVLIVITETIAQLSGVLWYIIVFSLQCLVTLIWLLVIHYVGKIIWYWTLDFYTVGETLKLHNLQEPISGMFLMLEIYIWNPGWNILSNKNYSFPVGLSIISYLPIFMVNLIAYVTVNIMKECSSFLHDKWGPAYFITMKNSLP
jgi:hypothetical protein